MWNYFGDIYYLKENTTVSDIWNCIIETFKSTDYEGSFPKDPPENFYIKNTRNIFHWNSPTEENSMVEFIFSGQLNDSDINLKICFDKNLEPKEKGHVHLLIYEEKDNNYRDIFFYQKFFVLLKKLVPKQYISNKIIDDRYSSLETINNRIFIVFVMDIDGFSYFNKKWIDAFVDDLWFLNAEFGRSKGINSVVNQQIILEQMPELQKMKKQAKKDKVMKIRFDEIVSQIREDKIKEITAGLNGMLDIYDSKSKIMVYSCHNTFNIGDNAFKNSNPDYETLKNTIIHGINYWDILFEEKIAVELPDYKQVKNEEKKILQEKIDILLREQGDDMHRNLSQRIDSLDGYIGEQEKKIFELQKENKALKDSNSKIIRNISLSQPRADIIDNDAYDKQSQKLAEAESEISRIWYEKSTLMKRNAQLNKTIELSNFSMSESYYTIKIPCNEKNLFMNEINDYLYFLLYSKLDEEWKNLPQNKEDEVSRKRDIIESLLNEKEFDWNKSETCQKISRIDSILRESRRPSLENLTKEGFKKINETKNHPKCYFYSERYQITFSLSPSDMKVVDNKIKEIRGRFLLL